MNLTIFNDYKAHRGEELIRISSVKNLICVVYVTAARPDQLQPLNIIHNNIF